MARAPYTSPFRGPGKSVGPFRHWQAPPLGALGGNGVIASGAIGTVTLTVPAGAAVASLGLSSARDASPFRGPGKTAGPIRHWAAPPIPLAGSGAIASGSLPTITLTAPAGGAVAALGLTSALGPAPTLPMTAGPFRRHTLGDVPPLGQQSVATGSLPTVTVSGPIVGAVASLGLTSGRGPAPFPFPLTVGPFRRFFVETVPPEDVQVVAPGAIGTITLTAPSGQAVASLGTGTPFVGRGPTTIGPARQFVPAQPPEGTQVVVAGSVPGVTITPPAASVLAFQGTASSLPWRGPETQGPARRFRAPPVIGFLGTGPITAAGTIGTVTLTAAQGSAYAASGTAAPLPWQGPNTQGPMRRFVAPPPLATMVSVSAPIGTIVLTAPTGTAGTSSNVVEVALTDSFLGLYPEPWRNKFD